MTMARTMGMTTAKATDRVTLLESEGFVPEESVELRLMNDDENFEQDLSTKRSQDTDSGRVIALCNFLSRRSL